MVPGGIYHSRYAKDGSRRAASGAMVGGTTTPTAAGQYDRTTNRLVKSTAAAAAGDVTYTDGRGNMTFHPSVGTMAYDAEDRLLSAGTAVYGYDGEGRRVKKSCPTCGTIYYAYDVGGELIGEYGGAPTAAVGTAAQYLTVDHLGSTRVVTGADQSVVSRVDYEPFGQEVPATAGDWRTLVGGYNGAVGQVVKFTGKERDAETGLDYFGARYFSGAQGRFTSPDWSASPQPVPYADLGDPQSLNLYGYVRNNPLSLTDPTGHVECPPCISMEDIDKVVKPLIESAGAAGTYLRTGSTMAFSIPLGGLASLFVATAKPTTNDAEVQFEAANRDRMKQQQQNQGDAEAKKKDAEPEAAAGGAGALSGGGRTGRKINEGRVDSAKDALTQLKDQLAKLNSTPNKTLETKDQIKKVQGQINRETDRLRKSEEHARQAQR